MLFLSLMVKPVTELKKGIVFREDGELWIVENYEHIKVARGSGTIKVKAQSMRSEAITEKSFMTGARVDIVDVFKKKATYLYRDGNKYFFMDTENFENYEIDSQMISAAKFLKDGMEVRVLVDDRSEIVGLELPKNEVYKITETAVGVKGNTVSNTNKKAMLENGVEVSVPLFVNTGDLVKIDTRTGGYLERVK